MADTKTIFVATFPEESKTYQAFSEIKALGASRKVKLEDLAIGAAAPMVGSSCPISPAGDMAA